MSENPDFVVENGVLTDYAGSGGDVVISEGVTEIGWGAFKCCVGLITVVIPQSVTKIDNGAFYCCKGLTRITIPGNVVKIGENAFYGCTSLTSVTIPESVTQIGRSAFDNCQSLTSIIIPKNVTEIGDWAFSGCTSLTSVTILDGVIEIGAGAFHYCTQLTNIVIPESVAEIRPYAFSDCTNLASATIKARGLKITPSVFNTSEPVLIAPHLPIGSFATADKPSAVCGFARLYADNAELDEEIRIGYLKYIRSQRKRLYPTAVGHNELLQLMFAEKIIPKGDIPLLLDEADQQGNADAKVAVLAYDS